MIKVIIFDFAGVITKLGFRTGLFNKLREKQRFDEKLLNQRFLKFQELYMTGVMSTKEFWEKLCSDLNISYEDFTTAFMDSYEFNPEVLELIKSLRDKYQIILLSDNFDIIYDQVRHHPLLNGLFERMFFSNEMKKIKNSPAIFEEILKELGEKAEECLFIDDKEANLSHAKKLGFKTIQFKDIQQFKNDLAMLGTRS